MTDPSDLIGTYVEVYDAVDGSYLMGRGRVIAYTDRPTIILRDGDGTVSHHVVDLPRLEYRPVPVGRVAPEVTLRARLGSRSEEPA